MVEKIKNILELNENRLNIKYFILLMLIAFVFSLGVRYIWLDIFGSVDQFKWNNQTMINTNDGYYYAEGARDILQGKNEPNDLSPIESPLAQLTATLAKIIPFVSFETLILWMPGVFGALLVVPMMLIAREIKQDMLGFFAALLGGIAVSYYNRTMIGYYDTDFFIVLLPTLMIWGAIYALNNEDTDAFIFAPLFGMVAIYWHAGTLNIAIGLFIMAVFYTIIFQRKNLYYYKFLMTFIIVLTSLAIWMKFVLVVGLIYIFHKYKEKLTEKAIIVLAIVSVLVYLFFGGFSWLMGVLQNAYVTRLLVASELDLNALKFYGVVNTVREAGQISFETFAERISGHVITFWVSVVGYLLLVIRYRLLILSLPMIVLGFFALQGGLRFTVFAVPFMALGGVYFLFLVVKYIEKIFTDAIKPYIKYVVISLCTMAFLYPNIKHIQGYKVPTVFQQDEVKVLNYLGQIASKEDYAIAWWDYGYPIRYYADVKTIVDGGKHDGKQNFTVAYALTQPQTAAANMARLDVEFTEAAFQTKCGAAIECMLKAYGVQKPNDFLAALHNKNIQRPKKTRDIFFYLPGRMMDLVPTIDKFSNLNIQTGETGTSSFFYVAKDYKEDEKQINLGRNIILNKQGATLQVGDQTVPIKSLIITEYDNKGILHKQIQQANPNAKVTVIFMKSYKQFVVVDERMLNSSYIQLFVLEDYDKELFEPVVLTPLAKVYKLKI
jgi:undecaprenyl-diphosphooligosaccharide---protein glycotransferase